MKIGVPTINDLKIINEIAVQVHECHVKWRSDIFEHADNIIDKNELEMLINNNEIFIIQYDKKIVGYIIISTKEGKKNGYKYRKDLCIDAMGIDKNYRNNGIGTKLLKYIKEYAKDNKYTNLRLTVNEENVNARHLYEKVGFKVKNIAYSMIINESGD